MWVRRGEGKGGQCKRRQQNSGRKEAEPTTARDRAVKGGRQGRRKGSVAGRAPPVQTQQRLAPECVLWTVTATNRCLFPSPITLTQKP